MSAWSQNPKIYEINTWVWLNSLSERFDESIDLGTVPDVVIEELARYKFDAIWLMGVWYRSPAVVASAMNYKHEYEGALPDITDEDIIGSAYAIGGYWVDPNLGGREGMARFRAQIAEYEMKLVLDYVPNHVATDNLWIPECPDYFITGTSKQMKERPGYFFTYEQDGEDDLIVAHGRDPYFPAWIDTAQLNAFSPTLRQQTINTLLDIADQCDGVRCDMAMLMMNHVFKQTWSEFVDDAPEQDFWLAIIPELKRQHPDFLFVAEVYWGLEGALLSQGFDYTYDKTLYDRLVGNDIYQIKAHLQADLSYLKQNIRFIENHDEGRAASSIGFDRSRPAATLISTLPGATLLHDGQFVGRKVKLPVQIGRQPEEIFNPTLEMFYQRLLRETSDSIYEQGEWIWIEPQPAWDGSDSHHQLIAYLWKDIDECRLVVINLAGTWSQAKLDLSAWERLGQYDWRIYDVLQETYQYQSGHEMMDGGLSVDVPPYSGQICQFSVIKKVGK